MIVLYHNNINLSTIIYTLYKCL